MVASPRGHRRPTAGPAVWSLTLLLHPRCRGYSRYGITAPPLPSPRPVRGRSPAAAGALARPPAGGVPPSPPPADRRPLRLVANLTDPPPLPLP